MTELRSAGVRVKGRLMRFLIATLVSCTCAVASAAVTTQPARRAQATTRKTAADAEIILNNLLAARPEEQPIQPMPGDKVEITPAPDPHRSRAILYDRVGRLNKTTDGRWEFRFDSDGAALLDPPLILLECPNLESMENIDKKSGGHSRFRITGSRMEYRGKGYLLVEKFLVAGEGKRE